MFNEKQTISTKYFRNQNQSPAHTIHPYTYRLGFARSWYWSSDGRWRGSWLMVLWLGLGVGYVAGLGWSKLRGQPYQSPMLNHLWLVFVGFLPQFLAIYFGNIRAVIPDLVAALCILASQLILLIFAWLNRHLAGMSILIVGLVLNMVVMATNRGFMPINPMTAERLVGLERIASYKVGSRIGYKDILLHKDDTRLELLADRFLPPVGFPYQVAFSLGDIFIAFGAFWMLVYQKPIN